MIDAPTDAMGLAGSRVALLLSTLRLQFRTRAPRSALATHVSYCVDRREAAMIRCATHLDFLGIARLLARQACPDSRMAEQPRRLRRDAIVAAAVALRRPDTFHLVVERRGSVCAMMRIRIAGQKLIVGRSVYGRAALAFDPEIRNRIVEHVVGACRLDGWSRFELLTPCADAASAESMAASIRSLGCEADVSPARPGLIDRLRFGGRAHRITVTLTPAS